MFDFKLNKVFQLDLLFEVTQNRKNLAKAGIHYAKINEKTDSHFRGNDKSRSFFCWRCFCV